MWSQGMATSNDFWPHTQDQENAAREKMEKLAKQLLQNMEGKVNVCDTSWVTRFLSYYTTGAALLWYRDSWRAKTGIVARTAQYAGVATLIIGTISRDF